MEDLASEVVYVLKQFILPIAVAFGGLLFLNEIVFLIVDVLASSYSIRLNIGEPSLGAIFTATVALASLYIAWNNFVFKRRPFLKATWDFEETDEDDEKLFLKLINLGETNVGLQGFEWSYAIERNEGEIYFTNEKLEYFDQDYISPEEKIRHELGTNVILAKIDVLDVQKVDGESFEIDSPVKRRVLVRMRHLSDMDIDVQSGIQRFFDRIQELEYNFSKRVPYEEFKTKSMEELREEFERSENNYWNFWRGLKHRYESRRYGFARAGKVPGDLISRTLFALAENKTQRDKEN